MSGLPLLLLLERKGPAMNANQVVIVMDRREARNFQIAGWSAQGEEIDAVFVAFDAALNRDPDELVEQGAASLHARHIPLEWGISFDDCSDEIQDEYRAMARSVLAVLGEEGTK